MAPKNTVSLKFARKDSRVRDLGWGRHPRPHTLKIQPIRVQRWDSGKGFRFDFVEDDLFVHVTLDYWQKQVLMHGHVGLDALQVKELGYDAATDRLLFTSSVSTSDLTSPGSSEILPFRNGAGTVGVEQELRKEVWARCDALDAIKNEPTQMGFRRKKDQPVLSMPLATAELSSDQRSRGHRCEELVEKELRSFAAETPDRKVVTCNDEESDSVGYDFEVHIGLRCERLIEVKSTAGSIGHPLKISARQLERAIECHARPNGPTYWLYCVFNADSSEPTLVTIEDPIGWIASGRLSLASDLMLVL